MTTKPRLQKAILLEDVTDKPTIMWIQARLADGDYIEEGGVDGIVGKNTLEGLAEFKEEMLLSYPKAVGPSTIHALSRLKDEKKDDDEPVINKAILLNDVKDEDTITWVQTKLVNGGFLDSDQVDGQVGPITVNALKTFKNQAYLAYPLALGPSTIDALAELMPKHQVSEQSEGLLLPVPAQKDIGTKTGPSRMMPGINRIVYANEMIVPGSYITWGEMTRNFTRMPSATNQFGSKAQIVNNMIATAKAFRDVRTKFGSPIRITSAYRPPHLRIGASRSQHKYARGLDMSPMNGKYSDLLAAIRAVAAIKGIGLAGASKGFWHMDIRPIARRVSFGY